MTPDAERRMLVYQEGQRAFNSGASCPYSDWRAVTWSKGREAAKAHLAALLEAEAQQAPTEIDEPELTMRDRFAMAAMTGLLAQDKTNEWSLLMDWSYDIANIAMKVRKERT